MNLVAERFIRIAMFFANDPDIGPWAVEVPQVRQALSDAN
jgi:hypothetical protein